MEAKVHALAQEVQRLVQECDEGNQDVALLEDALERDGEEVGLGMAVRRARAMQRRGGAHGHQAPQP